MIVARTAMIVARTAKWVELGAAHSARTAQMV
jgi:hypothetical protein